MEACSTCSDAERREIVRQLKQNGPYFNHYDMDRVRRACPSTYLHMARAVHAAFFLAWGGITSSWPHARARRWLSERSMPSGSMDFKDLALLLTWWIGVKPAGAAGAAGTGGRQAAAFYLCVCLGDATRENTVMDVGIVGDGLPKYKVSTGLPALNAATASA